MDAVNRDIKMVGLERKMTDDRRRWRRTIDDHSAILDDETSRRKRRIVDSKQTFSCHTRTGKLSINPQLIEMPRGLCSKQDTIIQ